MDQTPKNQRNKQNESPEPKFSARQVAIFLALLMIPSLLYYGNKYGQGSVKEFQYSEFKAAVRDGWIGKTEISSTDPAYSVVTGDLTERGKETTGSDQFYLVAGGDGEDLRLLLEEYNIPFGYRKPSTLLWMVLVNVLPILLIIGILYFLFMRQVRVAGKGAMNFGKSRAKLLSRERNKVTFMDVAGAEEAKDELNEIVEFLKDPKKFQRLGGRIPKGVLMVGSPGTGKTLLAKAIAGEADVPFFSISGSDFVEMFVGVGASRVRDMFEQAKKHAPCLIFIDEIDAVGRSRFSGIGGGHDEREQTLNALLVEMDGFEVNEGVIIIAATNRPDVLDRALLRPGRFDRQVVIDLPDVRGREAILKVHARKVKLSSDVKLSVIAKGTPGFSGAELANLINEAALLAARANKKAIDQHDMEEARDKVAFGRERKSRQLDIKDKRATAIHESGHAILQYLIEEVDPIHKVTIIPRGMYMGASFSLPEKDRYNMWQKEMMGLITVALGGQVAERIFLNDLSTGAKADIIQATHYARSMVCEYGMTEKLGPVALGEKEEHLFLGREVTRSQGYSEQTAQEIDLEVHRIIQECYDRAQQLITEHRKEMEILTDALLEFETISGDELKELFEHGKLISRKSPLAGTGEQEASGSDNGAEEEAEEGKAKGDEFPAGPGISELPANA
jgi:cell division protease FtsH